MFVGIGVIGTAAVGTAAASHRPLAPSPELTPPVSSVEHDVSVLIVNNTVLYEILRYGNWLWLPIAACRRSAICRVAAEAVSQVRVQRCDRYLCLLL